MDTDEDGVTDYIELQGWDVIVIHERRGEVMEDRCEYGVWSLPIRYDSEGDGASDETEWKFHGNPDSSDSDKDGIPDREESGPNLTMVEGTPPVILDKKGRYPDDKGYKGGYINARIKIKKNWKSLGNPGNPIKGVIVVSVTVVDNVGLDNALLDIIKDKLVALAKVMSSLMDTIKDIALKMVNAVLTPLKELIDDFVNRVANSLKEGYHNGGIFGAFVGVVDAVFNSALYWTLLILITVLLAIEVIVAALSFGATSLIGPSLVSLLQPIIISAILGYVAHETSNFLEEHGDGIRSFLTYLSIPLTIIDASLFIYKAIGGRYVKKGADITWGDLMGFVYGILGLILVVSEKAFGYSVDPVLGLFLDIVGLYLSFKGAYEAFKGKLDFASWVGKLAEILAYVSLGVSIADFLLEDYSDAYKEIKEVI